MLRAERINKNKMKEVKITCDYCGKDITTTGNSVDYRLALKNERIQSCCGIVTDMWITPCLKHDYYFCSTQCLKEKLNDL